MAVYKKGENWFIDFWCRGRRYRRKIGPSKRQAELALKKVKVEIAENKFFDVKKQQKVLFSEMAKEYIGRYAKINKKSFSRDEQSLGHLIPFFAGKYLYEISPQMIEDYKAKRLQEGVTGSTVNRELGCMKHIYTKAIEWGKATENPVKRVKLFKENNQRVRFLEKGEIKILLDVCPEFLKPIVIVALNTGMRQGEILNLKWDDIDLVRGIITIRNTKNNETRFIPLNSVLRNTFEKLKEKCKMDSPWVFCDDEGKRLSRFCNDIRRSFLKVLKEAGIKDFRFHDLRHTFASHLVMAGADIMTVKELLGHKTLEMTLRYSHLSPDFKRSTVELLCTRMDTFWTLGGTESKSESNETTENVVVNDDFVGESPSGKARDFGSRIRRFESFLPRNERSE